MDDENEVEEGGISKLLGVPLSIVRRIMSGYNDDGKSEESSDKIEMVGDKLRKKRLKNKRCSGNLNVRDYSGRNTFARRKDVGYKRSVVRYIGSNVPISTSKTACFQYLDHSRKALLSHASTLIAANMDQVRQHVDHVKYHVVPSLADLGQLVWDDGDNDFDDEDYEEVQDSDEADKNDETIRFSAAASNKEELVENTRDSTSTAPDDKKITALEDELAKLRAQIAMIVSNQAAPPLPVATVVPTTAGQHTTAFIPPPPPPPPMLSTAQPKIVVKKISREENTAVAPTNMSDVLKGLANVKLKSIDMERSPGGTPMKKKQYSENPTNPADIIAKALHDKFKHSKMSYDSPDHDGSPSSFSPSPQKIKYRKSPKIHSKVKTAPKPRPRPRAKTQKKRTEAAIATNNDSEAVNTSFN